MRKYFTLVLCLLFFASCNENAIEKPDNLIDEDKMVNIIYDLTLLEAARVNNSASLRDMNIEPDEYVYKKYKIDSLQFVNSDRYYASDIKGYSKIYDRVTKRLERETQKIDSLKKFRITPDQPKTAQLKDTLPDPIPLTKRAKMTINPNVKTLK